MRLRRELAALTRRIGNSMRRRLRLAEQDLSNLASEAGARPLSALSSAPVLLARVVKRLWLHDAPRDRPG